VFLFRSVEHALKCTPKSYTATVGIVLYLYKSINDFTSISSRVSLHKIALDLQRGNQTSHQSPFRIHCPSLTLRHLSSHSSVMLEFLSQVSSAREEAGLRYVPSYTFSPPRKTLTLAVLLTVPFRTLQPAIDFCWRPFTVIEKI
jgi:hypothetical protein